MERRWVLVLGASGGYGAACCRAFGKAGYSVLGVHLDTRARLGAVEALQGDLAAMGCEAVFFNQNAADDVQREAILSALPSLLQGAPVGVVVHALAFGALGPLAGLSGESVTRRQLEMTLDVMGTSLVYWVRDLVTAGHLRAGGRVLALTSAGNHRVWKGYGPVSLAKAALDAAVRQLAVELAPLDITANSIQAGITPTAAARRIPGWEALVEKARISNPHGRITTPGDVAACLVDLARPGTYWMTGNILRVDGGEDLCG
jgi:enoyl-[acyl-carrier protein] reductase III